MDNDDKILTKADVLNPVEVSALYYSVIDAQDAEEQNKP